MDDVRFDFGNNWSRYSSGIDERTICSAVESLCAMLKAAGEYRKDNFLDMGCGSGIHAIAAQRIGFQVVTAVDLDPASVSTTLRNVTRFGDPGNVDVFVDDILNSTIARQFDVVYSWGVLHHTGAMWSAIAKAAEFVSPNGLFCIAVYKRTAFCAMWRRIKRLYAAGGPALRATMLGLFLGVSVPARLAGQLIGRKAVGLRQDRGMDWLHDSIDWIGGYPYESASPADVVRFVEALGFRCIGLRNAQPAPICGLLGSGCVEYVFKRPLRQIEFALQNPR